MRLIDADALKWKICFRYPHFSQRLAIGPVFEEIEKAQTLDAVQVEIKPIEYRDCAYAMLKMWMDDVVTDGEYARIMDKLNAHCRKG